METNSLVQLTKFILHKQPIKINNKLTDEFSVQKVTRKGCPLSPLLFVIVLEVLLREIQRNEQFRSVKIKNYYKYIVFADNVIFFLEDLEQNFPLLLNKIEEFSYFAGLYINKMKSKLLLNNIREEEQELIEKGSECEIVQKGLELTAKNVNLFKNNYIKTWNRIKFNKLKLFESFSARQNCDY